MKRVLFTSYDGLTDNLGQSQIIPYLTGLSKKGFRISVLSCEKRENFRQNQELVHSQLAQANIDWHYVFYTKKPPVISTLYDLLRMYFLGKKVLKAELCHLIHSRTLISAVVGFRLKKKFNTRFIFDMRGFWADERAESGMWKLSNPLFRWIYNFFKKEEAEMLAEADYTICLTERAKKFIQSNSKIPGQPIPIKVIPCCADLELFSPKSVDEDLLKQLKTKFGLTGSEFVLSYLGSIGTWYMLDEMLDFFRCLLDKQPSAKFLFITNEPPEIIISKAKSKSIDVLSLIISPAEHYNVPTYLALSNWSLFFIKPVFSKSGSSPTKQGEIMGMGIPHICNAGVGDVDEIMRQSDAGIVVKNLFPEEYYRVIEKMIDGLSRFRPRIIQQSAVTVYSLEKGVEKYNDVYEHVLSK